MQRVVILLLGASFASAVVDNVGPCNVTIITDKTFNIQRFSEENNGVWLFVQVPLTNISKHYESMFLVTEPNGFYGQYHTIMYYKNYGDEEYKVLADEDVYDSSDGHVTVVTRGEKSIVYKISFLKYVHCRYAFYHICSDEGGVENVDYRHVLAHGPLTDDERAEIQRLDEQHKFSGVLIDI
uniref:Lipocalin/cytosolic fatty-acid binding domain-containing protein n=1 Tax=Homalodisca liturata TaxID=320908 RepID=A0A1B6H9U3_9HEMI